MEKLVCFRLVSSFSQFSIDKNNLGKKLTTHLTETMGAAQKDPDTVIMSGKQLEYLQRVKLHPSNAIVQVFGKLSCNLYEAMP